MRYSVVEFHEKGHTTRMSEIREYTNLPLADNSALRFILEGTSNIHGEAFFTTLVTYLTEALNVSGALVTEYLTETNQFHAFVFKKGSELNYDFIFDIENTPCATTVANKTFIHIPDKLLDMYPNDPDTDFVSYMGVPLLDAEGELLGHLAVVDEKPMPEDPKAEALFRIFADRAATEILRIKQEQVVREREERYFMILESAMDAMLELDSDLNVTQVNPAAESIFQVDRRDIQGKPFSTFFDDENFARFATVCQDVIVQPELHGKAWLSGGFYAHSSDGQAFPIEAALSCFTAKGATFYSLVMRNVNKRHEHERRIETLLYERELLQQELENLQPYGELIGTSKPMRHLGEDIRKVSPTDATVLILGETGTGKEVIARTIHAESSRADKPLVKVNCAAIPAALMESEFFGHEKGAFTGATEKREGRFAMADGGTIFLDELCELPLDLQVKLLRVLQEGEFDLVGGTVTRKVDVRVIAATNQDIESQIANGKFREDLYYRLNVFPINVPPLRDRGNDIILLAGSFIASYANDIGRSMEPINDAAKERLTAYNWPGNVRELQNIVERGVITANGNTLNLDRALPNAEVSYDESSVADVVSTASNQILTVSDLLELEKTNILKALDAADGKVSGENGAAALLGMKPTTLSSRIKALGINRNA